MISKNNLKQKSQDKDEKESMTFGEYLESKKKERQIEKHKPSGCSACGNSAYPNCKLSCPLFDD